MNTRPRVEIDDRFIARLIGPADTAGGPSVNAEAPAADPGDGVVHAISQWARTHSDAPAYN
ncbi:hypothetical protein [Glycomyces sp. NPDC047010]|uniref:hypothetical protein n=1 Tax=Glycomyces sp. NPDC047010 TaxID=3155023 RepID=UPI003405A0EC